MSKLKIMKIKWSFIFLVCFSFCFVQSSVFGYSSDTLVVYVDGKQAPVLTVQKGVVSLYATSIQEAVVQEIHGNLYTTNTIETKRFFISNELSTEEITPSNYKSLIIKYLPNAPYLHKKLGKLGFRYENVSQMIEFYNKFRVNEQNNRIVHSDK